MDNVDTDDDNDGIPDSADNDDDNDGVPDNIACPKNYTQDEDDDNGVIPDVLEDNIVGLIAINFEDRIE